MIVNEQDARLVRAMAANYALEHTVRRSTSARGQCANYFAPSARLKARRPAAQRER